MRLIVGSLFVEAMGEYSEIYELRKILKVRNPKAKYSQNQWYSKKTIEPYIDFLTDDDRFLRGLLPHVEDQLKLYQIPYTVERPAEMQGDLICVPDTILPNITLRDYQTMCIEQAYAAKRGVVQVATGGGKTSICAGMAKLIEKRHNGRTMTFVNKVNLMEQTVEKFQQYGLENVGWLGKSDHKEGQHMVAMIQSAHSLLKRGITEWTEGIELVNWDETHHLGAESWSTLAYAIDAPWSIGYSGTPFREGHENFVDPSDVQMLGITGGVIAKVTASYLIERGLLAKPYIFMLPCSTTDQPTPRDNWQDVEKAYITQNGNRNNIATRIATALVERGMPPLVIVSKIEHGKEVLKMMARQGLKPVFVSGGPKVHVYEPVFDTVTTYDDPNNTGLQGYLEGKFDVLIGSSVMDEGVDLPAVTAVLNLAGGKSFIRNLQRIGRGLRPKKGANEAYIFDFIDTQHSWLYSHSKERIKDFKTEHAYVVFEGYQHVDRFFGGECEW